MTNSVSESLNIIYHSRHIVHVFLKKTRYEPVRFCMIVYTVHPLLGYSKVSQNQTI